MAFPVATDSPAARSRFDRERVLKAGRLSRPFLWDKEATGGVKLGTPLVCVAAAVTVLSLSRALPADFLRRVGGLVLLGVTALFVVQLGRRFGWDNLNDNVGIGPWLAGVGGLLALLAPPGMWPLSRSRPAAREHTAP